MTVHVLDVVEGALPEFDEPEMMPPTVWRRAVRCMYGDDCCTQEVPLTCQTCDGSGADVGVFGQPFNPSCEACTDGYA